MSSNPICFACEAMTHAPLNTKDNRIICSGCFPRHYKEDGSSIIEKPAYEPVRFTDYKDSPREEVNLSTYVHKDNETVAAPEPKIVFDNEPEVLPPAPEPVAHSFRVTEADETPVEKPKGLSVPSPTTRRETIPEKPAARKPPLKGFKPSKKR